MKITTTPNYLLFEAEGDTDAERRREWLEKRREVVTASDVALLCSNPSWIPTGSGPSRIYSEKVEGKSDYDDRPKWGKQPMYWGSKGEEQLLAFWAEVEGGLVLPWPKWSLAVSVTYPWLAATPDATWREYPEAPPQLLEAKCSRSLAMYENGLPDYHRWQTQTQMIVTRISPLWMPVRIQGDETRKIGPVMPDPETQEIILSKSEKFYREHLVPKVPPVWPPPPGPDPF